MVHRRNRLILKPLLTGLALLIALLAASCPRQGVREPATEAVKLPVYSKSEADIPANELIPAADELAGDTGTAPDDDTVDEGAGDGGVPHPIDPTLPADAPLADGEELYRKSYCAACHEPVKDGRVKGPKLENLKDNWDAIELSKFLRDPGGYAQDNPRLVEVGRQYNLLMPSSRLSDAEIEILAAWVLEKFE